MKIPKLVPKLNALDCELDRQDLVTKLSQTIMDQSFKGANEIQILIGSKDSGKTRAVQQAVCLINEDLNQWNECESDKTDTIDTKLKYPTGLADWHIMEHNRLCTCCNIKSSNPH